MSDPRASTFSIKDKDIFEGGDDNTNWRAANSKGCEIVKIDNSKNEC